MVTKPGRFGLGLPAILKRGKRNKMTQCMKFFQGDDSIEITEAFDNKTVRIYGRRGLTSLSVDIDERRLIEMRNWINRQLLKMKKPKGK